ncbi:MAG: CHAT domain-containing protein, partial [Anaerolineae bacterium]
MAAYADLEIGLHRRDADNYGVELRFSHPGGDADVRLTSDKPTMVQFDLDRLRTLSADDDAYGQLLAEGLFVDEQMRTAFAQALSSTQALDVPLRMRLFVGPSAPELHGLWWETLRHPQDGSHLVTGEHVLFSRYLSSLDWRPVGLRPQADLRALLVISNPADVSQWQPDGRPLAPVDVDGEMERARAGLAGIPLTSLASAGSATLEGISAALRDGYDVLYLVCHGALVDGEPHLWLEDEAGKVDVVAGKELVTRIREMRQRPRLVVLASCQSAGQGDSETRSDDRGALAALGPRLAEAGIPAVLAMQGNVTMQTVAEFMPVFFRELQRDGQIDRAVSVARGAVRERPDWWVPVLF